MPHPRKATGNACAASASATTSHTPLHTLCQPAEPPSKPAGCLLKTLSTGTAVTTATVGTGASSMSVSSLSASSLSASSLSACSSQLAVMEVEVVCPVTGTHADVTYDYDVSPSILGKGHYGVVRECVDRSTGHSFAVKSIDKSRIGRLDHLQREISLLDNVDHPGVVRMVDCYEDAEYVHIVTEKYDGGELFDRIIESCGPHGCFSERRAAAVLRSLLEAVAYLHDNDVVHRDIKPENVLFESNDEDSPVRLVDLGLSRHHYKGDRPMTSPVGTAYFMSPELLAGSYDQSTDLWSVGVVAYVLLCGVPPFNGACEAEIHEATRTTRPRFRGEGWTDKSDAAVDFVKRLLRKDPGRRLTAREALAHPWIRNMTT